MLFELESLELLAQAFPFVVLQEAFASTHLKHSLLVERPLLG